LTAARPALIDIHRPPAYAMPTMLDSLSSAVTEDGVAIVEFSRSPFNVISVSGYRDTGHLTRATTNNRATGVVVLAAPQGARLSTQNEAEKVDGRQKPLIREIRHEAGPANAAFAYSSNVANVEFPTIDFASAIVTPTTLS